MTARRRAILIVILALLLVAILATAIWLLFRKAKPTSIYVPQRVDSATSQPAAVPAMPNPLAPAVQVSAGSTAAAQMAELFAERYGSYSNQGNFGNLKDLLPVMTATYRAATEAYLAAAKPSDAADYQGVTSVKISTKVRSYDASAGTATVAVMLQQQKSAGASVTPSISYRSLKMTLKKSGSDWRVDSAAWEN